MANLSLTTRPQCFKDVIGQQTTIEQILNYLNGLKKSPDTKAQPLILSGPRGLGKTTTARLIAKFLNCQSTNPTKYNEPCQCENCKSIEINPDGTTDYIEMDGASNNGVADIEQLVERTFYAALGEWLVITIDECHMLTRNAWNYLLKQLEEPPKRVLYILATTEENKIIETVKSRCKIRRFRLLDDDEITSHLLNIIQNPNYIDNPTGLDTDGVIPYIVSLANGSLRDAIKTLGDVLDLSDKSLLNIQRMTGSADVQKIGKIFHNLFNGNIGEALIRLNKLENDGIDPKRLMDQMQQFLADLLNVKVGSKTTHLLSVSYYAERFEGINISLVSQALRCMLETANITHNTITIISLTYGLVFIHQQITQHPTEQPNIHPVTTNQDQPPNNFDTVANRFAQMLLTTKPKSQNLPKNDIVKPVPVVDEEEDFF